MRNISHFWGLLQPQKWTIAKYIERVQRICWGRNKNACVHFRGIWLADITMPKNAFSYEINHHSYQCGPSLPPPSITSPLSKNNRFLSCIRLAAKEVGFKKNSLRTATTRKVLTAQNERGQIQMTSYSWIINGKLHPHISCGFQTTVGTRKRQWCQNTLQKYCKITKTSN